MALEGHITVTTEELSTQASVVQTQLSYMMENFNTIKALIDGTQSYWTGTAGDVHRQLYSSKQSRMEEMFRRFQEHIRDLQTMAGIYQQAEHMAVLATDDLPASTLD